MVLDTSVISEALRLAPLAMMATTLVADQPRPTATMTRKQLKYPSPKFIHGPDPNAKPVIAT